MHRKIALGLVLSLAGCELVLGDLPAPKKHSTASSSGSGGAQAATSTDASGAGAGGAQTSQSSTVASSTASASSSGAGGCCDCDGDLQDSIACGGTDCDDNDKRVYLGEPVFYDKPSPTVGFDYDCQNGPQRKPTQDVTVNCGLLALPCSSTIGYLAMVPPACGQAAPWGGCKQSGITCVNDVLDPALVMPCK